jgi:hypothetical protein
VTLLLSLAEGKYQREKAKCFIKYRREALTGIISNKK